MKNINNVLLVCLLLITNTLVAQINKICANDTISLTANNHQYGTLEWERSVDNINWIKIPNAHNTIYKCKPTTSEYYRVANKFPYCEPTYSSITLVQTQPVANAGKDRIVNNNFTFLTGNTIADGNSFWTILEGAGGVLETPNAVNTKFTGVPADGTPTSPSGVYKLQYTLQNDCGVSNYIIDVKFVHNTYHNKLVFVDATDTILSTEADMLNGNYNITFSNPVPVIDNQTILIAMVGNGFMRKVATVSQNGNTFTMTTTQAKIEDVMPVGGLDIGQLNQLDGINQTFGRMANGYTKLNKAPTRNDLLTDPKYKTGVFYFVLEDEIDYAAPGVTHERKNVKDTLLNKSTESTNNNDVVDIFNFDDTELYNQGGLNAKLDGGLTFKSNFVADFDINLTNVKTNVGFNNATFNFTSKLTVVATTAGTTPTYDFNLMTLHKNLMLVVLGVPTLIQIKTKLNGTVKANASGNATFISEFTDEYKVNAGITYDNGTWNNYFTDSNKATFTNNLAVQAQVTASLDVGPKMYFTINGILCPYIDAKLTTDTTLCASTQNVSTFNWGVNLDIGAKLTVGCQAYMFKKQLFDYSKTWENRKLFNEKLPYLIEMLSGNNQQYNIGTPLQNPIKVRVLSKNGYYIPNAVVTFEIMDNSGTVGNAEVLTDSNGVAETTWTPTGTGISRVKAYVKDCDFNFIQYAPLVFTANQVTTTINCTQSTLNASFLRNGNSLLTRAHLGVPPYTYATDLINFTSTVPIINITPGSNYIVAVKDAAGCVAFASLLNGTINCADTNLILNTASYGKNITATATGGTPPYTYALNNGSYGNSSFFSNNPSGDNLIRVKDANNCVRQTIVTITNSTTNLVAYFNVNNNALTTNNPIEFTNLSANATSYLWNFGNSTTSALANPSVQYNTAGTYTVTLTAYNGTNSNVFSKTITITNPTNNILGIVTVPIPAGTFTMGSPTTEPNSRSNETQHQVTLSAFTMSKNEITCAQYATFLNAAGVGVNGVWAAGPYPTQVLFSGHSTMGLTYTSGQWVGAPNKANAPMVNVNWFGAASFAQYAGGRLPTESEWEYAARGNTTSAFNTGACLNNTQANYNWANPQTGCINTVTTDPNTTQNVGLYPANTYGLHDMHGNAWEWCADWFGTYPTTDTTNPTGPATGAGRVLRGGSWVEAAQYSRSAYRFQTTATDLIFFIGFRLVF